MRKLTRVDDQTQPQTTGFAEKPLYEQGLFQLSESAYGWIEPNGLWGESNAGLIVGKSQSILVDTLWDIEKTKTMLQAMQPLLQEAPIKQVVNTQANGEHFFGNQAVAGEKISSAKAVAQMRRVTPKLMQQIGSRGKLHSIFGRFSQPQAKIGRYFQQMVAPYNFKAISLDLPTRTFDKGLTLELEDQPVHLIEADAAFSEGDTMVYLPVEKVLFAGDLLYLNVTPIMWAGPVTNLLAALDRMLAFDVDVIVPGHGPVCDKNGVLMVQAYWEYVAEKVGERFRAGMDADIAASDILLNGDYQRQPFANWKAPERIMTNTHTIFRHLQGRIDPLKRSEIFDILRQQALLANAISAEPAIMRLQ